MNGLTNYITEQPWTDIVITWYVLVDTAYQDILKQQGRLLRQRGPQPVFTDSEVITVALIIETFFQGNEEVGHAFVRQYMRHLFPELLDLDRFNQRRRELIAVIEAIRCHLRDQKLDRKDPVRLVDSAPISRMTYSRGARCISVVGHDYFGVVTSKKGKVFGLRLHATVTTQQLIDDWLLAPAAFHDAKVLCGLVEQRSDLVLVGDKGYTDATLETYLWETRRIQLLPLRRQNQKRQWPDEIRRILGRIRHHVETVFSVASTVFNLERPRGRSLAGHVVRVATIILAHTLSFFMA
jgi:hypothetical protein